MNWGKGLVIGLGLFMGFVVFLVVMMFQAPDDSFDKDYYEKGLDYDQEYNRKKQVLTDNATPEIKLQEDSFNIVFSALDSGNLKMVRPSSHLEDEDFKLVDKKTTISTNKLKRGEWKLIIEWNANNKEYLYEKNLFIP